MQELGTERAFVEDQYSDAARLRIRIETHRRYSQGDTDRILDDATRALHLSPGLRKRQETQCEPGSSPL